MNPRCLFGHEWHWLHALRLRQCLRCMWLDVPVDVSPVTPTRSRHVHRVAERRPLAGDG